MGRGPLLAETELTPWDIQVKAQAVWLAGKLRQSHAPSANRPLNGELGKALACAKRNGNSTTRKNTRLDDSLALSVAWSLPQVRPTQGAGKRRWKEHLRKGMKEDTAQATRASLKVRPESLEEGGRQASTVYVGMTLVGTPGQEAALRRGQVPSRALRAQLRNLYSWDAPRTREGPSPEERQSGGA